LAHLVPLVRGEPLVIEDSLELTAYQDLRVHKEIVVHQVHLGLRVLWETLVVQENLVYQVQGV